MTKYAGAGNPNGATDERHQPKKRCPICGENVKGLPYHISSEHSQ